MNNMTPRNALTWQQVIDEWLGALAPMRFGDPVTHVYNPLEYAQAPYQEYLRRYGGGKKEVLLVGMNPGPWGMAQTGIPFGEVHAVTEWLRITAPVGAPKAMHPKRPVEGFACRRSEVSGRRVWGWARRAFHTPERFFARCLVVNYCPLMFVESGGRNRTPDKLPVAEQRRLFAACDRALWHTARKLEPRYVFGIGRFAAERARLALSELDAVLGQITHPSPANPRANRGWEALIEQELSSAGLTFFPEADASRLAPPR
jgi:single-strand selective monofunctional uracil DNA glycosylase